MDLDAVRWCDRLAEEMGSSLTFATFRLAWWRDEAEQAGKPTAAGGFGPGSMIHVALDDADPTRRAVNYQSWYRSLMGIAATAGGSSKFASRIVALFMLYATAATQPGLSQRRTVVPICVDIESWRGIKRLCLAMDRLAVGSSTATPAPVSDARGCLARLFRLDLLSFSTCSVPGDGLREAARLACQGRGIVRAETGRARQRQRRLDAALRLHGYEPPAASAQPPTANVSWMQGANHMRVRKQPALEALVVGRDHPLPTLGADRAAATLANAGGPSSGPRPDGQLAQLLAAAAAPSEGPSGVPQPASLWSGMRAAARAEEARQGQSPAGEPAGPATGGVPEHVSSYMPMVTEVSTGGRHGEEEEAGGEGSAGGGSSLHRMLIEGRVRLSTSRTVGRANVVQAVRMVPIGAMVPYSALPKGAEVGAEQVTAALGNIAAARHTDYRTDSAKDPMSASSMVDLSSLVTAEAGMSGGEFGASAAYGDV